MTGNFDAIEKKLHQLKKIKKCLRSKSVIWIKILVTPQQQKQVIFMHKPAKKNKYNTVNKAKLVV